MNIGLLGHGTIGLGVDRIIRPRNDMKVTKILSLIVDEEMEGRTAKDISDIVNDPEIDTVVEVMGGVHPAYEFIAAAMKNHKNVVTANKAVVAACYKELVSLAKETGVSFRSTAAVGGSIPWLVNLERAKRVDEILEVSGIMNGTTNYILDAMKSRGLSLPALIKEAQALGYAEADPTADIEGFDIRRKLNISVNVAFDVLTSEEDIPCIGISRITEKDIENAKSLSRVIKLKACGKKNDDGSVTAFVEPELLEDADPMAGLTGSFNLLSYEAVNAGTQGYLGMGAGRFPTAYNVVEDLADILERKPAFYTDAFTPAAIDNSTLKKAYYVRTVLPDACLPAPVFEKGDGYIITEPVSVKEMHDFFAAAKTQDPSAFIAGIG